MEYLLKKELIIKKEFLNRGYIIKKIKNKKSLNFIKKLIIKKIEKQILIKNPDLNKIHKFINKEDLNNFRLSLYEDLNKNERFKFHYFNLGREILYELVGNEIMMQKKINLSIQLPGDESSLLPIHSDVWSGDSPYEINLWMPLVNCYKTKSMYIIKQKDFNKLKVLLRQKKYSDSTKIFGLLKKKLKWLKVNYGEILIFNQTLPHGNVVNEENATRISLNCRFKSIFSPYKDKKIGEFFIPVTTRAMTEIGINYEDPF